MELEWVEFDAGVEVMPWGRNVYTIVRLDHSLEDAARALRTRRVEGSIDQVPVNVGVNRADALPDAFVYAGKGLLRRLGARQGDIVRCRLRPADPDDVPLADDINRALTDAGRLDAFERQTPAQRRLLLPIEDAGETRNPPAAHRSPAVVKQRCSRPRSHSWRASRDTSDSARPRCRPGSHLEHQT